MKISTGLSEDKVAIVACDVSKDRINVMMRLGRRVIEEEWANRSQAICASLDVLQRKAALAGFGSLRVVAEPTGVYHRVLLRTARRLGLVPIGAGLQPESCVRVGQRVSPGRVARETPQALQSATCSEMTANRLSLKLTEDRLYLSRHSLRALSTWPIK